MATEGRDRAQGPADGWSALLQATSSAVGAEGDTTVVLIWERQPGFTGYNLYARAAGGRRARRINGNRPIRAARTCRELRRHVAEGSPEWAVLGSAFTAVALRTDRDASLVDPCEAMGRGLSVAEAAMFDAISSTSLAFRLARGTAFVDRRARPGKQVVYELRGVLEAGNEVVLATEVLVTAGVYVLPDPPTGLTASVGDRKVLILWNRNPYAAKYVVQRATNAGGPFQDVNPKPVAMDVERDIDDQPVVPPRPGFLDYQYWTPDGAPTTHTVGTAQVDGPFNGTTYYYRVASQDELDRRGAWSATVAATPVRSTPPMAPDMVQVSAQTGPDGLNVSWRKVDRDVDNHQIADTTQTYRVYRAADRALLEDLPSLGTHLVATVPANPSDPATPKVDWTDTSSVLVQPYGEKTFFYRLTCTDVIGKTSAPSAIIGGFVPDTRAPGPTFPDGAKGFADQISVFWKPNTEPDLAGYQVYRGVCDKGTLYRPFNKEHEPVGRCDLTLVGQVTRADAEAMSPTTGQIQFDDRSVPEGSPLCYAYWIRAYDAAQNLYDGDRGCPTSPAEYTCMRLLEQTAPPAPIITGLRARDDAVLVEWISSPVQDLKAFHVYRSDDEFDKPTFLACVFIDGTIDSTPWTGLEPACVDIPAEPDPLTARGSFLDGTAVPGQIYWYRVSALDWLANESESADLTKLPSSSTFTYSNDRPVVPMPLPPVPLAGPECGLKVFWNPFPDPALHIGFVVFRSANNGPFRQVSGILDLNFFIDTTARPGVRYAYRIQSIDPLSRLSEPSVAVIGTY
jgi:hypothetical protein